MKIIQVAGTNAKGSVAAFAAGILQAAGYKCGLFISPHLVREEERISINGQEIPRETMRRMMEENPGKTLFHTYLNACLAWFRMNGVEAAVMETGLGGRYDPVTGLHADVNVLTRIGMDHMEILGDTLEKITLEKCATIQHEGTVINMEQAPSVQRSIEVACQFARARLVNVREEDIVRHGDTFDYREYRGLSIRMLGEKQPLNACVALEAVCALSRVGIYVEEPHIRAGLGQTVIPGRTQYFPEQNLLIDGAHNEDAIAQLENTLDARFPGKPVVLLTAAMQEKDVSRLAEIVKKRGGSVVVTQVDSRRGRPVRELSRVFRGLPRTREKDWEKAFLKAQKKARRQDALLVAAGSFYLAGELLKKLQSQ